VVVKVVSVVGSLVVIVVFILVGSVVGNVSILVGSVAIEVVSVVKSLVVKVEMVFSIFDDVQVCVVVVVVVNVVFLSSEDNVNVLVEVFAFSSNFIASCVPFFPFRMKKLYEIPFLLFVV
jgi:hypothetical protein